VITNVNTSFLPKQQNLTINFCLLSFLRSQCHRSLTLILRVEALLEAELLTLDITKTFSWREECIIHHLNITVMVKVRTEKRLKDGERYKERERVRVREERYGPG
jgi:hypothetical protein